MRKHSTKTTKKPARKLRAKQKDPAEAKFEAEFGRGLHELAGQASTGGAR